MISKESASETVDQQVLCKQEKQLLDDETTSSSSVKPLNKTALSIEIDDDADDDDEDYHDNNDEESHTPGGSTVGALTPHGSLSSKGKWTSAEDLILKNAVETHDGKNWKKISDMLEGRTDVQCLHRWQKVLRPGLIKGPWTKEVKFDNTFF